MPVRLDADDRELEAQGYHRSMPRRFTLSSLLALGFALTATWNGFGAALGNSLSLASTAGTIWTLIFAAGMNFIVSLGMAELVSAYPNSGAQYYWSFRVASSEWAPFASYMSACTSTCGWWLGLASVSNFIAAVILATVQLWVDEYTPQPWHQWASYVVVLWTAVAVNVYGIRALPAFNKFILYFSISTLTFTIVVILWCAAPRYQPSTWVFTDAQVFNPSYDRNFLWILCLLNNTYGFMGTDAGAHLAEEIPSPKINAPKVIIYPVFIGLATAWPFALACMYVIRDVEKVIHAPSGLALIEVYLQATESTTMTTILLAAFAICMFGGAVANVTGSSRQIWAAARDDCYPMSALWAKIDPTYQMPFNAACLSAIFTSVYGLIFLGSETAFTSMVSANIVFMMVSYVIPQGIVVWRGRSQTLSKRTFDLGRWGPAVNIVACAWVCFLCVVACFPVTLPVNMANMNWVGVVSVVITTYMTVAWRMWQRHVFKGPRIVARLGYEFLPDTDRDRDGLRDGSRGGDNDGREGFPKNTKGE